MAQRTEHIGSSLIWGHESTPAGNRVARCGQCPWLALFKTYEEADYRSGLHYIAHHEVNRVHAARAWDRRFGQERIEALLA